MANQWMLYELHKMARERGIWVRERLIEMGDWRNESSPKIYI